MPDWLPWALLAATYLMAGITCARHLYIMDGLAASLARAVEKEYTPGYIKKVWPIIVVIWPALFWTSFA